MEDIGLLLTTVAVLAAAASTVLTLHIERRRRRAELYGRVYDFILRGMSEEGLLRYLEEDLTFIPEDLGEGRSSKRDQQRGTKASA